MMRGLIKNILGYGIILFALFYVSAASAFNASFSLELGGKGTEKGRFQSPTGIAVSDGIIYVVDSKNNRVQLFTERGEFNDLFGSKGDGEGQFSSPYAIAIAKDGRVFITDSGNSRVQVFDRERKFLYAFGKKGSADGDLSYPKGIAVDVQERVYVADSGNRRVSVFTTDGIYLDSFGEKGSGKGQFYDPAGISVSADGLVWVADSDNNNIQMFDAKGVFKASIGSKGSGTSNLLAPSGIHVDSFGRAVVADSGNGRIQIFNNKGEPLGSMGSKGEGRAQFLNPQSVYLDESGICYIADSGNNRVQVFSLEKATGKHLDPAPLSGRLSLTNIVSVRASDVAEDSSGNLYILDKQEGKVTILDRDYRVAGGFGKYGREKGMFSDPSSIAIGDNDRIFISDTGNHRIQVFDNEGKYLYEFGGKGSSDGKLYSPGGLAYKNGKLLVADTGNYRIQVFNPDGIFLTKYGKKGGFPGELSQPVDVAVSGKGNVYVADYGNKWVQVFSPEGKPVRVIGKEGSGRGEFTGPRSIVLDDDDRLFVLESEKGLFGGGSNRVQVFDRNGEFLYRFSAYGKGRGEINSAESISYANREDVSLFISDTGNNRFYHLNLKDVPSSLKGVKIESNEKGAVISWQKAGESFVNGYRIYASPDAVSGYRHIADLSAQNTGFELEHRPDSPDYYFAVSALAKGGLEGPMSEVQDSFKMGHDGYLAKRWDDAVSRLSDLLKENPYHEKARYYLALSHLSKGGPENIEKAREIFSRLSSVSELEEVVRLNLGKIALMQGRFSAAESEFNRVLAKNPGNTEVYSLLGKTYFDQGLYQKSLENLLKASEVDSGNPEIFEMTGVIYHKSKAYEKAVSSFKKAVELSPDNPVYHKELGETYLAARNLKEAREEFRRFIEKAPSDTVVLLLLAETALELKDGQEAFDYANIALTKGKDNPSAHIIKGKALVLLGKKEDALLAFKRAFEIDPKNEEARFRLAFIYRELGLAKEAMESLQGLFNINRKHEAGHILMAELLTAGGDREKAVDEYRKVQQINPQNAATFYPLGRLLMEKKDYEKARIELERAVKVDRQSLDAYLLLGRSLRMLGRSGEAINAFQFALEINRDNLLAREEMGRIYMDSGIMEKAINEFKAAAALAPENATVHNLLGKALLLKFRFDEAITSFDTAARLDPQESFKKDLNDAYEAKKKFLSVKHDLPMVEIRDADIQKVFASLYKYYSDHPIGEIKISNNTDDLFSTVKVSLKVMNYMDFPTDREIKELKPRAVETVPVYASFNNKILEIVEDTPAQAEIEVSYYRENKEEKNKLTIPFTIYNRNSITWNNPSMAGAFVTPKDEPVKEFARGVIQQYPASSAPVNKQMATAMMIFDALGAYGVVYSPDPNNPFEKVSIGENKIDSIQYPRETLKLKTGDCDDLSTLVSALLENVGIETAFIGTPGHLHMMFKLDIDPKKADTISLNPEQYVVLDNQIWIPVETTVVGSSFSEAWYKGSEIYYRWKKQNRVEITNVHDAWGLYQSATLPPAAWSPALPSKEKVDAIMSMEVSLQKTRKIARLIKQHLEALEKDPKDIKVRMELGLIYAENGLSTEAIGEFTEIVALEPGNASAYTNMGNIYLMAGAFDNAVENYKKAEKINPRDAEIKVNLAIAYYKKGLLKEAQAKFKEAVDIDPGIKDEKGLLNSLLSQ